MAFQLTDHIHLNRGGTPGTPLGATGTYYVETIQALRDLLLAPSGDAGNDLALGIDGQLFLDVAALETTTSITYNSGTQAITYTDEDGVVTTLNLLLVSADAGNDIVVGTDGGAYLAETVTSLTYNQATGIATFTDEAGVANPVVIQNIYNADGTLTGPRTVNMAGNGLTFQATAAEDIILTGPGDQGIAVVTTGGYGAVSANATGGGASVYASATDVASLQAISTGADAILIQDAPVGFETWQYHRRSGLNRWLVGASSAAETGGNAGTDLVVARSNDAGALIDFPWYIRRDTGIMHAIHNAAVNFLALGNTTTAIVSGGGYTLVTGMPVGVGNAGGWFNGTTFVAPENGTYSFHWGFWVNSPNQLRQSYSYLDVNGNSWSYGSGFSKYNQQILDAHMTAGAATVFLNAGDVVSVRVFQASDNGASLSPYGIFGGALINAA